MDMNQNPPFVGYFSLPENDKSDSQIVKGLEDNLSCGQSLLTLSSDLMHELLEHPERVSSVKKLYTERGATCRCAHSDWGEGNEMSLPFEGDRKRMIELTKRTLELTAEFGGDTCAFHAETWSNESLRPRTLDQWRSYIDDALEAVLPVAERCGVIIALENIWTEIASPEELNGFVERFKTPWLGLCFDAGHANVMSASGKRCCGWLPWACRDTGVIPFDDHILDKMLPNIVTVHLHDNASDTDSHDIPGHGNIDWKTVMGKLKTAPRLRSYQHEVSISFGYSARTILDAFKPLFE